VAGHALELGIWEVEGWGISLLTLFWITLLLFNLLSFGETLLSDTGLLNLALL
jgi:hypothetical protein